MNQKFFIRLAVLIIVCLYAVLAWGYAGGITGQTKKNGNNSGCWCHNGAPSSNVSVSLTGPDSVRVNETANYKVTISGGPLLRGGTDIAVSLGELILINGSGLRENKGELTHFFPKAPEQGSVIFSFSYKAPPFICTDTIFANGNSVNFDITPYNDQWNYAGNKKIVVFNPIGIINQSKLADNFRLFQNYPNPFNPETIIGFEIQVPGRVNLYICDLSGKAIAELVNQKLSAGAYKYTWDASYYPSGVYFYILSAGKDNSSAEYSETKRMILIK